MKTSITQTNNDDATNNNLPPMRKSCKFCRSRKIRCSGGRICAACTSRNIDCIYGRECFKGRPRGNASSKSLPATRKSTPRTSADRCDTNYDKAASKSGGSHQQGSPYFGSETAISEPNLSPISFASELRTTTDYDKLISSELREIFHSKFLDTSSLELISCNASSRVLFEDNQQRDDDLQESKPQTKPRPTTYNKLFFSLGQSLIQLASTRFGSLGCYEGDTSLTRYYATALSQDESFAMFDDTQQQASLPCLSKHQVCQMVELWFSHHPLSILVSKTLLLHSYNNNNHDEGLLSVILADASFALNGEETEQGHRFFQSASDYVAHQKSNTLPLSTIQTLVLLGWHNLCFGRARRGYCYLELARSGIVQLMNGLETVPKTDINWINGVDVNKVESELSQRIYWLTFGLELWIALQMGTSFRDTIQLNTNVPFLPISLHLSIVFELDKVSGNVANFHMQEESWRGFWPFSHIASTLAPIYALFPRNTAQSTDQSSSGWEVQTISKLHHLRHSANFLPNICENVREILSEGIEKLQEQMNGRHQEIFAVSAYRMFIINLLFPQSIFVGSSAEVSRVTFETTLQAVSAFRDFVVASLDDYQRTENTLVNTPESPNVSILVLGLDACSRALKRLCMACPIEWVKEHEILGPQESRLQHLIRVLRNIVKDDSLQAGAMTSAVKKRLLDTEVYIKQISACTQPETFPWTHNTTNSNMHFTTLSQQQVAPRNAFDPLDYVTLENIVMDLTGDDWRDISQLSGTFMSHSTTPTFEHPPHL